MGIALAVAGLVLIVTGAQNTYAAFGSQVRGDFVGPNNFTYWFLAIMLVGMLGYIPALRTFSRWFLALILISILFSHKGFFASLTQALQQGPKAPAVPQANTTASGIPYSQVPGVIGQGANPGASFWNKLLGSGQ